ncbi:MAG: transcriptional repressor [Verrucomicrobiota bacterium]
METSEKREWALAELRRSQARLTPVREKILGFLARNPSPATLTEISGSEELARQFDDATVYRTLVLLVELEIARQFQFQGRQTHFLLNVPGECFSFLICRCCGAITRIPHGDELYLLERQMADRHGYVNLTHELEVYGTCPGCRQRSQTSAKPTKLLTGLRLHGRYSN